MTIFEDLEIGIETATFDDPDTFKYEHPERGRNLSMQEFLVGWEYERDRITRQEAIKLQNLIRNKRDTGNLARLPS